MIPKITDQIASYVSAAQAKKQVSSRKTKEDLAYVAIMMMYLSKMHETVMDAWKKFSETTEQLAEDGADVHRVHQLRRSELEGQRRRVEFLKQDEGNYIHRQAAAFHSLEKESTGNHLSHRHLLQVA